MTHFTEEQLEELETVFGLKRVTGIYKVRDGHVTSNARVWWWCENGPEMVLAKDHADNIQDYPGVYSIERPRVEVKYLDK